MFKPVRTNLGQQVFQHLLAMIYKMEIEPGAPMGVSEIAEQLGVSRSPVRDAMLMLIAEGVVEQISSSGYRVIQFDRKYIDDVYVFRRALELASVRLCVQNLDIERVEEFKSVWLDLKATDPTDPTFSERHLAADNDFHQSLGDMSGNALIKEAIDRIISIGQLIRRWQYSAETPDRQLLFSVTIDEHLNIIDAILEGSEGKAVQLLVQHLEQAHQRSLARLELNEPMKTKAVRRKRSKRD
jgi:DNA-binding GntR family transcriptional regulator